MFIKLSGKKSTLKQSFFDDISLVGGLLRIVRLLVRFKIRVRKPDNGRLFELSGYNAPLY